VNQHHHPYQVEEESTELVNVVGPNSYKKPFGIGTVPREVVMKIAAEHASEMNTAYNAALQHSPAMAHTKPPFRIGQQPLRPNAIMCAIVADDDTGLPDDGGFKDVEHYGGNLIAESVTPGNAQFIVDACNFYWRCLKLVEAKTITTRGIETYIRKRKESVEPLVTHGADRPDLAHKRGAKCYLCSALGTLR
jgi:hypothetical protein